jgi:hypothetical protein
MQGAFLTVVVVVGVVGLVGALIALAMSRSTWESLGRDRLLMESDLHDPRPRPHAGLRPAAADADERATDIRQMLEARNRRRRHHGEAELDVEAELGRLLSAWADDAPGHPPAYRSQADPELVAEVRQFVLAHNHRRVRRGQPPLDVEAEIKRQIARLNG